MHYGDYIQSFLLYFLLTYWNFLLGSNKMAEPIRFFSSPSLFGDSFSNSSRVLRSVNSNVHAWRSDVIRCDIKISFYENILIVVDLFFYSI